ncbi:MAG: transcription-repair coupling factor [Dehalococcoidia bacterium]|nr:transcription-repair coupling factor [Dehalococcoidia bacterium]
MGLEGLFGLLEGYPAYVEMMRRLASDDSAGSLEAPDPAKPYLLASVWRRLDVPVLLVVPRPEDARRLHDQLLSYLEDGSQVYLYPEPEVLPFERLMVDAGTNNQRMMALQALCDARTGAPGKDNPLVVASAGAALRKTLSPDAVEDAGHSLRPGDKVQLGELYSRWVALGYLREEAVEVPGTFSQRGGIVDVFPPSNELPFRMELWGDEIESIRLFDPSSQRSVGVVEQARVCPARDTLPALSDADRISRLIQGMNFGLCTPAVYDRYQEELALLLSGQEVDELPFYDGLLNDSHLAEHLPGHGLLVVDREGEVEAEVRKLADRVAELRRVREFRGELPANFPSAQVSWTRFYGDAQERRRLYVKSWSGSEGGLEFRTAPSFNGRPQRFAADVARMLQDGERVVVVSRYTRRVSELLSDGGLGSGVASALDSAPAPGSVVLVPGNLREGWRMPVGDGGAVLFTDSEIFGAAKERRPRRRTPVKRQAFLSELVPGAYVVHVDHGVASFTGTTSMDSGGEEREYLVLEYAEGDKLYVPTEHLDRVSPYLASNDRPPSLTRLGTAEWTRIKERVKHAAREMAEELLELYASRQVVQGRATSSDTPWQRELEDSFPYEETEDQERTIVEVKGDLEKLQPMDRLVCGDVGYGKTEVALRAAFKTVSDGMQVGVLVPTTVLAQQHYATFTERLAPFPVRVAVLSRFRTRREQAEVVEGLKLGTVDIVIGTHRLLQKDVRFKDLGLVVVDEEHRFGVAHKERLKRMRREVDMLTLSATPIPRTLYMGLSGIRDMSTMDTPPEERLPVKTYVSEYSDDVVKEAILRELERGGQVFLLHNRVQTIRRVEANLRKLLPQARIAVGHGRMAESELEEVMLSFSEGEVDVLVCTTIIESGLDIPNANTLIIDRADRFGLAQLYQLRGRVGRGGQRAYAYLLVPRGRPVTEAATRRLKVILEATELGSGFRIAMRDLEIRGAGNLLGAEQSGYIHAVGFDLYSQLLNEAVADVRSSNGSAAGSVPVQERDQERAQARVDLDLAAYIPESYVSHLPTRLGVYQRLTRLRARHEIDDTRDELRDRFGPLPQEVENLLYLVDLKLLASGGWVESISQTGATATMVLKEQVGGARLALERALGPLCRVGNQQVHVSFPRRSPEEWKPLMVRVLERLTAFQEQLRESMASVT